MHLNKVEKLKNGQQLFIFFSNDKGRGKNNCTIQLVPGDEKRKLVAKMTKNVIKEVYTTSWKGDVNFSRRVQSVLNVKAEDLFRYEQIKRVDKNYRVIADESAKMCFDLAWLNIERDNKSIAGIVTMQELKVFCEKLYCRAWVDCERFQGAKNGVLAKIK